MDIRSDFGDVQYGSTPLSHLILLACDKFSDDIALIQAETGQQLTYKELKNGILATGSFFHQSGLRKGDIVIIFSTNHLYYPVALLGLSHIGAIATTLNPLYTTEELSRHIEMTNPKYIITTRAFSQTAKQVVQKNGQVKEIFCFDGPAPGCSPYSNVISANPRDCPNVQIHPEDIFIIPCSSGTTGLPKGVLVPNRAFAACLASMGSPHFNIFEGRRDVALVVLPFYHVLGMLLNIGLTFLKGVKTVVLERFEVERYFDSLQRYKVTVVGIAPPIAVAMTKHPLGLKTDMSSLKYILCGGAPLPVSVQEQVQKRIPQVRMMQVYGMTEILAAVIEPKDHLLPGSIGKLVPNCSLRVVDTVTGKSLGPNKQGEVWIKSPFFSKGYLGNKKATDDFFSSDGFAKTGDIGYYNKENYIFLVDRSKELIKYKGFQVAPAELEGILLSHPSIEDAAVIGIPDETAGELPFAFIVRKPGMESLTQKEVFDHVKAQVSPQKWLRGGMEFRDAIPKLPSGKILRRVLRDELKKRRASKL